MHNDDLKTDEQRRKLVKFAAGAAVAVPLSGLVACSGGDDSDQGAAAKAKEAAESAAEATAEAADEAADTAKSMADDASDAMSEAADEAGEAMGDMAEQADDMMADAKDKADGMMSEAQDKADGMMADAKDMAGDAKDKAAEMIGGLPKLQESDPVAQALGYVHDASKVDQSKYAGRGAEANEYCKNCALYQAREGGWGACSIFAGKAVNQNGWCASYNRAAS